VELRNDFRVAVPVATAWRLLTDVERVAPCLPGAQLQEIEAGEYRGLVKVKVGPITAQYKGKAVFAEQDVAGGRLVVRASGRENGGDGHVTATVTASLVADGDTTVVNVVIDLAITGPLAQIGQSVLSEVSANLLGQFAECLDHQVLAMADDAELPVAEPEDRAPVRRIEGPEVEPVDLFQAAGNSITKRVVPPLAAALSLLLAVLWWRRRSRR
jgi:carbon monoxide dehydrogenase subunit G